MQHAPPCPARAGRALLPALLMAAAAGAFGGLAALPPAAVPAEPAPADPAPAHLAFRDTAVSVPTEVIVDLERASRSRVRASPSPRPVPPKPSPKALEEKPAVRAVASKAPATKSTASAVTSRDGSCPVPAASFTDTWGAPRSEGRTHQGTDLLAPHGSSVYAVAAGVISTASSSNGGISLYLQADDGERYFYAHNSANLASDGEQVRAGELIARVGATGNASGGPSHVHFEREVGGDAVNPYAFLRRLCR